MLRLADAQKIIAAAQKKAAEIGPQSGGQFFGIHASNDGRVMICLPVARPLKRDGKVVGAIGVSGGSGEQDHAVAEAGAQAL